MFRMKLKRTETLCHWNGTILIFWLNFFEKSREISNGIKLFWNGYSYSGGRFGNDSSSSNSSDAAPITVLETLWAINDNQNIKTNEKQTLNDKFKQSEWQKYETVSQESSRWIACSHHSKR